MDLSRTVSEIDGDFGRKPLIFPIPVNFTAPWLYLTAAVGSANQSINVLTLSEIERRTLLNQMSFRSYIVV